MNIDLLREVQTNKEFLASMEKGNIVIYKGWEFCILTCGTFQFNKVGEDVTLNFVKGTLNNWVKEAMN